jgi:O-antigen/teichoic acid export membrane protein
VAVENIGKRDLIWATLATLFRIGSGVLLFPMVLNMLPSETVGVWTIFTSVTLITTIMDFGFSPSFARNVAYIFSGVRSLKRDGHEYVDDANIVTIDYGLLKRTIRAMQYFYSRIALILFLFLSICGTFYIFTLMQNYAGDVREVYVAWAIVCLVNSYNLYTLYYDALLNGRGLVKRKNQIVLIGNVSYLLLAVLFLLCGLGLVAIVSAQLLSVLVIRILSRKSFYDKNIINSLSPVSVDGYRDVLKAIMPNAIRLGLASIGGFLTFRLSTFVGPLYIPLSDMASFGITLQLLSVVSSLASLYTNVYLPKVFQWRVENNLAQVRKTFYLSCLLVFAAFFSGGLVIGFLGNWILGLLGSQTQLLSGALLVFLVLHYYLETNMVNATEYLLAKNEVPFYKRYVVSGCITVGLLFFFVGYCQWGLWGIIAAPMISQSVLQYWKWPYEAYRELKS